MVFYLGITVEMERSQLDQNNRVLLYFIVNLIYQCKVGEVNHTCARITQHTHAHAHNAVVLKSQDFGDAG